MGDKSVQAAKFHYCCCLWNKCIYDEENAQKFPSQESFSSWKVCMHITDSQCMCVHFSAGWLSLRFGSLDATEIQTGDKIISQQECQTSSFGTQEMEPTAYNFQSPPGHSSFQLLRVLIFFSALLQYSAVYSCRKLSSRQPASRYSVFVLYLSFCCGK